MPERGEPRDGGVLDANLTLLLNRCYRPALPRVRFRDELRETVLDEVERVARERRGELRPNRPAMRVLGGRAGIVTGGLVAAAAAVLLWFGLADERADETAPDAGGTPVAGRAGTLESFLARGEAAWRPRSADGDARWRSLEEDAPVLDGSPFLLASAEGVRAEVRVPEGTTDGAGSAALVGRGELAVGAFGAPADELRFDLAAGRLELRLEPERGATGAPWRITAEPHELRLVTGELVLERSGESLVAFLVEGEAMVSTHGLPWTALEPGRSWRLDDAIALVRPASSPDPTRGDTRESVPGAEEPGAEELDEAVEAEPLPERGVLLVVRGADGEPVSDFGVLTVLVEATPNVQDPVTHRARGRADGRFAVELEPGDYIVQVTADGFGLWQSELLDVSGGRVELEVVLEPALRLTGVVVDPDGAPVEGAWVVSETEFPPVPIGLDEDELPELLVDVAYTGADGRYELEVGRAGEQLLRATHDEFAAAWTTVVAAAASTVEADPIRLTAGARIVGEVDRADGTPWVGAVVLAGLSEPLGERGMSYRVVAADEEGNYAIDRLPPGDYAVLRFDETGRTNQPDFRFLAGLAEGGSERVDFTYEFDGSEVRVVGRLTYADGSPARFLGLSLANRHDISNLATQSYGFSGEDGTFELGNVKPGSYEIYTTVDQGQTVVYVDSLDVPQWGVVTVEAELGGEVLRGRVMDGEAGELLPQAIVIVAGLDDIRSEGRFVSRAITDARGEFEIEWLRPGLYRVIAYAASGRLAQASTVEVLPMAEGRELELVLFPGGHMDVRVEDEDGRPIAGAQLTFVDETGQLATFDERDATRANGRFQARGAPPGVWTVRASKAGYVSAAVETAVLVDSTSTVVVQLERAE